MKETIRISVIIPVYHVESYIGHFIDSLKAQTMRELEFIFVDDCSRDGSMEQVEAFAAADDRVRIFHNRENSGPGISRNVGIEKAQGEYLSFLDPDDWIHPDFYRLLYARAVSCGCDIIKGTTIGIDNETGKRDSWWEGLNDKIIEELSDRVPLFLSHFYDHYSALYRAALFSDPEIRYGTSRNSEDMTFLLKVFFKTERIAFEKDALYFYRENRSGSETYTFSVKRSWQELKGLEEKVDFLSSFPMDEHIARYLVKRFLNAISNFCASWDLAPDETREVEFRMALHQAARKIPDRKRMLGIIPEMDVFLEYGYLISYYNRTPANFHYERIRRWSEFLVQNPGIRQKYFRGMAAAILSCSFAYLRRTEQHDKDTDFLGYVRGQIKRLEKKDRLREYVSIPAAAFGYAVAEVKGKYHRVKKRVYD